MAQRYEGRDLEAMSFAKRYHEWIIGRFRPYMGKRVAEVGAGSGNVTELLLSDDIEEFTAIEPSNMFPLLEDAVAGDSRVIPRRGYFSEVAAERPGYFDTVVYVNVLEHVEDDAAELRAVYASLVPGGYACVFVPALPALYSAHDASIGHFRRYKKRELVERFRNAGFEIVVARYMDILGIIPWFIVMRVLKRKPGTGSVALYDTLVVPFSRFIESLVTLPVGKNLLVVARKPVRGSRDSR